MDINLNIHFPDLDKLLAVAGRKTTSPETVEATVASAPAAKPVGEKPPVAAAKKAPAKETKAAIALVESGNSQQTEVEGNTNTGCIIMIRRVAAMDGKDDSGNDKVTGITKARAILQGYGGVKVTELPKDKWADFIADCQKALDAAGEVAAEEPTADLFS